jgi:hypothetical protein
VSKAVSLDQIFYLFLQATVIFGSFFIFDFLGTPLYIDYCSAIIKVTILITADVGSAEGLIPQ